MNHSLPKGQIEALTFIHGGPGLLTLAERNRCARFLKEAWGRLWKRIERPAAISSAVEWSSLGL